MSTKTAPKPEAAEEPTTSGKALQAMGASLPPELLAEAAELEGAGTSGAADDNILPFIVLLQDMSPETKKRDPKYVEGAEPGLWLNKATGQLYKEFDFQPCAYIQAVVEWVPRDAGGGVAGRHQLLPAGADATCKHVGGKLVQDPRDSTGRKQIWKTDNGNDLVHTRYQYGHVVSEDGLLQPVVISFSSTGHGPARQFMTLQRGPSAQMPKQGGGVMVAPAWFRKYKVTSTTRSNNQGEWFVPKFEDYGAQGWLGDANLRAAGRTLYESVQSGAVQAAAEDPREGGEGGNLADADVPF